VIIAYAKNLGCPTAPATASLSAGVVSWTAPATVPAGQTLTSYTVLYRLSSRTGRDGWAIYARSTGVADLNLNITGTTSSACLTNNPTGWTCVVGDPIGAGTTFSFRVIARTNTGGISRMATAGNHTYP
jgi:hypothetical protein